MDDWRGMMRQLDLFATDQVLVRSGFEALEILDLDSAEEIFNDLEKRFEDVEATAREVLGACSWWRALEAECTDLPPLQRATRLWSALKDDEAIGMTARNKLRKGLAHNLLDSNVFDLDVAVDGLCRGVLLTELEQWQEAEKWYCGVLVERPSDVLLRRQLGDMLWRFERRLEARVEYQRALLISPEDVPTQDLPDHDLAAIIEQYGPTMAPVYGWLATIFTLPGDDLPNSRPFELLTLIKQAEDARRQRDHEGMVDIRQKIMETDQEVFSAYMRRLA